jgi:Arc/MetJ-type ribon-helix-helix transcriptional regulator
MSYQVEEMNKEKISITLDASAIDELDRLVDEHVYKNRSQAIQAAIGEKLLRMKHIRLSKECSKLEPAFERALSEEGLVEDAGPIVRTSTVPIIDSAGILKGKTSLVRALAKSRHLDAERGK